MFSGVSNYTNAVDNITMIIMGISLFLLLGVTFTMLLFVFKYHHTKHPKPEQIHGNVLLEIAWVVIPTLLVIGMFFVGYVEYINLRTTSKIDNHVAVRASSWNWRFIYKNGYEEDNVLRVPVNKATKVDITSSDVLHCFFLKDFRIKEDAVPGRKTFAIFIPLKLDTFRLACAEFCGAGNESGNKGPYKESKPTDINNEAQFNGKGHFNMYGKVIVMTQEDYDKWYLGTMKKMANN